MKRKVKEEVKQEVAASIIPHELGMKRFMDETGCVLQESFEAFANLGRANMEDLSERRYHRRMFYGVFAPKLMSYLGKSEKPDESMRDFWVKMQAVAERDRGLLYQRMGEDDGSFKQFVKAKADEKEALVGLYRRILSGRF